MREIKFRAWDIKRNAMHYGVESFDVYQPVFEDGEEYTFSELMHDNNFALMRYTGLKDKNGKEIYEWDIVTSSFHLKRGNPNYDTITFHAGSFLWHNKPFAWDEETMEFSDPSAWAVVSGNIYENTEPL